MASSESLPMLTEFPRWLSSITLERSDTQSAARWSGINTLARLKGREITEALIRIALKTRQIASDSSVRQIREAFYAADNTFEMKGNDRELQVLAGAALAARMASNDEIAAESALATAISMVDGNRHADLPMDLQALAEASLARLSETTRQRPNLSGTMSTEPPKFDFEKAAAKAKEGSWDSVAAALVLAAETTRTVFALMARRQAAVVGLLENFLRVQDEELQMLWWLTGERSFDLAVRFDALAPPLQPLVFGKELAYLTQSLPGPRSINALLSRAGLKERKKIALADAINAAEPSWLREVVGDLEPSPVIAPIHLAIKRQLETGPGDAWIAGWAAATELPRTLALSPLGLAMLFYRENVLLLLTGE